jgi:tRNA A-37 threonylcarbamoyl transferase component Bud32
MLLDYGSHASIRITKHGRFPILKLAHSDEVSIKLIQYEFDVLAKLTKLGLPVVEFDHQPILDNGVTCGYRMEKLSKLEASEFRSRADDIKQALDRLHCAGFSHGDVGPSNIMTKDGRITLIDPSFAGRLGSAVPSFFPSWVYTDGTFGIGSDLERFGRYIVPM